MNALHLKRVLGNPQRDRTRRDEREATGLLPTGRGLDEGLRFNRYGGQVRDRQRAGDGPEVGRCGVPGERKSSRPSDESAVQGSNSRPTTSSRRSARSMRSRKSHPPNRRLPPCAADKNLFSDYHLSGLYDSEPGDSPASCQRPSPGPTTLRKGAWQCSRRGALSNAHGGGGVDGGGARGCIWRLRLDRMTATVPPTTITMAMAAALPPAHRYQTRTTPSTPASHHLSPLDATFEPLDRLVDCRLERLARLEPVTSFRGYQYGSSYWTVQVRR